MLRRPEEGGGGVKIKVCFIPEVARVAPSTLSPLHGHLFVLLFLRFRPTKVIQVCGEDPGKANGMAATQSGISFLVTLRLKICPGLISQGGAHPSRGAWGRGEVMDVTGSPEQHPASMSGTWASFFFPWEDRSKETERVSMHPCRSPSWDMQRGTWILLCPSSHSRNGLQTPHDKETPLA